MGVQVKGKGLSVTAVGFLIAFPIGVILAATLWHKLGFSEPVALPIFDPLVAVNSCIAFIVILFLVSLFCLLMGTAHRDELKELKGERVMWGGKLTSRAELESGIMALSVGGIVSLSIMAVFITVAMILYISIEGTHGADPLAAIIAGIIISAVGFLCPTVIIMEMREKDEKGINFSDLFF